MLERDLQLLLWWMNAGVIISFRFSPLKADCPITLVDECRSNNLPNKIKRARILIKYESKIIFIVRGRICRYNKHRNIFFKNKIIFTEGRRNAEENA